MMVPYKYACASHFILSSDILTMNGKYRQTIVKNRNELQSLVIDMKRRRIFFSTWRRINFEIADDSSSGIYTVCFGREFKLYPHKLAAERLKKGTAQWFWLLNSARIFSNLCWYYSTSKHCASQAYYAIFHPWFYPNLWCNLYQIL